MFEAFMASLKWTSRKVIGLAIVASVSMARLPILTSFSWQAETGRAKIDAPSMDTFESGTIQITGTATDPAFLEYDLDFTADPPVGAEGWQPVQPPIAQQVQDGVLAAWDTSVVSNGKYWIRLRVVRQDGSAIEDKVRVRVVNVTATPILPQIIPTLTAAEPVGAPPGPAATMSIWQPPTRTPRPTMTPGGPTPTLRTFDPGDSPFRPELLQQAAWNGLLMGVGAFVLLGGYALMRAAVRGETRGGWRQFRADFINPVLNALIRRRR
jgi:hypothetical protein